MTISPWVLIGLFLCGAALSSLSAAAGAIFAMWINHVAKTGCSPLPSMPKISLFKRKPADDDEPQPQPRRTGP